VCFPAGPGINNLGHRGKKKVFFAILDFFFSRAVNDAVGPDKQKRRGPPAPKSFRPMSSPEEEAGKTSRGGDFPRSEKKLAPCGRASSRFAPPKDFPALPREPRAPGLVFFGPAGAKRRGPGKMKKSPKAAVDNRSPPSCFFRLFPGKKVMFETPVGVKKGSKLSPANFRPRAFPTRVQRIWPVFFHRLSPVFFALCRKVGLIEKIVPSPPHNLATGFGAGSKNENSRVMPGTPPRNWMGAENLKKMKKIR